MDKMIFMFMAWVNATVSSVSVYYDNYGIAALCGFSAIFCAIWVLDND